MKAYKGIVRDGVVVLETAELPEGTVVTVTVGESELLRATLLNWVKPRKKIRLKPIYARTLSHNHKP